MSTLNASWSWTKDGKIHDTQIEIKDLQKFVEKAIELEVEYISISYFKPTTEINKDKELKSVLN